MNLALYNAQEVHVSREVLPLDDMTACCANMASGVKGNVNFLRMKKI